MLPCVQQFLKGRVTTKMKLAFILLLLLTRHDDTFSMDQLQDVWTTVRLVRESIHSECRGSEPDVHDEWDGHERHPSGVEGGTSECGVQPGEDCKTAEPLHVTSRPLELNHRTLRSGRTFAKVLQLPEPDNGHRTQ